MTRREKNQARLAEILDRLGRGLRLHVDQNTLVANFGRKNMLVAAKEFAKLHRCGFIQLEGGHPDKIVGMFFRAYAKREPE